MENFKFQKARSVKKVSLFEIKEVDKKYYDQRLRDYLPDSIFDVHTHVYLPQVKLGEKNVR